MQNSRANEPIDARYAASLIGGLSGDLLRAMQSAIPTALRSEMPPERAERVTAEIFAAVSARYRVNASATLIAMETLLQG